MEQSKSFNASIFLLSTMIISSCGGGNSVINKKFSVNAIVSEEHPISNEERNIATRICYAYQSKSNNFRTSAYFGSNFIFSGKNTDCQSAISNYQISTNLKYDSNSELIYATPSNFDNNIPFNKKVQTDRSGYFAVICSKILRNESISNTIDQSGVKVQISFVHDGLDNFLLQYFNKQSDNTYKIDSAENFKVRSQFDFSAGKILGMDESYKIQRVCHDQMNSSKISEFEQNFLSNISL